MRFPLVGNSLARQLLDNAFFGQRIPHAILIEGESGTGKTTLSRYIAAAALCSGEDVPCGGCRSCHLVSVGSHPDLYVVEPEAGKKNISVEQIRTLRGEAYKKAQMGKSRVFIIENAETLNQNAQNAILKVLEEPPGDTVFILNCVSASSLLVTVNSRCVKLTLTAPDISEGKEVLLSEGEKPENAEDALIKARGNIGRAKVLLGKAKRKEPEKAAENYLAALGRKDKYEMLKITLAFLKDRQLAEQFFSFLKLLLLEELRAKKEDKEAVKHIFSLYDITESLSSTLNTNINLTLLFSAAAEEYINIGG